VNWKTVVGRLIGPLSFIALVALGMAIATQRPAGIQAVGDFTVSATQPRVLAIGKSSSAPSYISLTLEELDKTKGALSQVSFLLPEDRVDLAGGSVHHVRVLERHADFQIVEYTYASGKWRTRLQYRAFRDRIVPLDRRTTNHLAGLYAIVPVAILALIGAAFAHLGWKFYLELSAAQAARRKSMLITFGGLLALLLLLGGWLWL
jgi:hypothetical protein